MSLYCQYDSPTVKQYGCHASIHDPRTALPVGKVYETAQAENSWFVTFDGPRARSAFNAHMSKDIPLDESVNAVWVAARLDGILTNAFALQSC